jgi:hypothetical protein
VPYSITRDSDGELEATLLSQDYLESELPLTCEYLSAHKETLESREGDRFKGRDDWYDFGYPKSMDRFENPKLIGAEISSEATFMLDDVGSWYFKAAYGVQLEPEYQDRTELFAGLLNSKALDFYLKHFTSLKMGGYYKYTTNYLSPLPIAWDDDETTSRIRDAISEITQQLDLKSKSARFPEAYLGEYDGQLGRIEYEWQTRRYPVNASVEETDDGRFVVTAGNTDEITDPLIDSGDRAGNELRAEYVCEAVNGRNMKSGEEISIQIPVAQDGVEELLERLEEDVQTVAAKDINSLEEEIDEAVYELFGLSEDEQQVVEDYHEVF